MLEYETLRKEIFTQFENALEDAETAVEITEGYSFDYTEIIRKIELYRASKFLSGDIDSEGHKKYFFNICNPQAGNVTKFIDLDTKDVLFRSKDGQDRLKSSLMTDMFRHYARQNKISVLFNEISEQLPIWGHIVVRKYEDGIRRVPLKNVRWDMSVSSILKSPYVIFEHYMQPMEVEKMKEKGWDANEVDALVEKARKAGISDICIYEYMSEFENEYLGKSGDGYSLGVCFLARLDDDNQNTQYLLYRKGIKEYPVKELKLFDVDGRALGLGIFEILFDLQERTNEMVNQRASSMRLSTKTIFQTRDNLIQSNIMDDVVNGEIIKVQSEITPINNAEKNLAAYAQEEENILRFIRNNANAQEVLLGESLPSGTPFRLGAMLQQNASALFGFIREKFGIFVKEMVEEWILPDFKPETLKEQIFEVQNNDLIEEIFNRDINRRINDAVKKYVLQHGYLPTNQEIATIKAYMQSSETPSKFVDIAKDYLNFKYDIDVVVTDENENTQQQVETLTNVLTLLAQNPAIMTDPNLRKPFNELLEKTGVSARVISSSMPPQTQQAMMPNLSERAQGLAGGGAVSGVGGQPQTK